MRIVKDDEKVKVINRDEVVIFMYVWAVTYVDKIEDEPVVTLFKKKEPAQRCYEALKDLYPDISMNKCPVYKDYYVTYESQQIYLR